MATVINTNCSIRSFFALNSNSIKSSTRIAAMLALAIGLACGIPAGAQGITFNGAQIALNTAAGTYGAPLGVAEDAQGNLFVASGFTVGSICEIPLIGGSYGAPIPIATGTSFYFPEAIAVDSSENLYVANAGSSGGTVYEIAYSSGSGYSNTATAIGTNHFWDWTAAIAVDASGNVFVADGGDSTNGAVYKISAGDLSTATKITTSDFIEPWGVAVDGSGDVFVSDRHAGHFGLWEISTVANPYDTVAQIGGSYVFPAPGPGNLALDMAGDLFVADYGNSTIEELTPSDGYTAVLPAFTLTDQNTPEPLTLAVGPTGNLFASDVNNNVVDEIMTSSVNFGPVNMNSAANLSLQYTIGAGVTLGPVQVATQNAAGLDFSAGASTCSSNQTASPVSCAVAASFGPLHPGQRTGAVAFTDGSGNPLLTTYLYGAGTGPQVTFPSGSQSPITMVSSPQPRDAVIDASGNIFYVDVSNQTVNEALFSGGYSSTPLGGSFKFSSPLGIALDGADNVYVADSGPSVSVIYEIPAAGGYATVKSLGSGFSSPMGVAVDGSGNVFVADSNNNAVDEILAAGNYSTVQKLCSCMAYNLAVDGSGNVFFVGAGTSVFEIPAIAGGYGTVNTLNSNLSDTLGVAVDASGNVYIADNNLGILELPVAGGYSTIDSLGAVANSPQSIALDGLGNVYFGSTTDGAVEKLDFADAPTLTFTALAGSSSTQSVTVANDGNAELDFSGFNISNSFSQTTGNQTIPDCASSGSVGAGASCNLSVEFQPLWAGSFLGEGFTILDNALNSPGSNQTIWLNGTGTNPIPVAAATTIAASSGSATYSSSNQAITLTATVSSTSSVNEGTVTFSIYSGGLNIGLSSFTQGTPVGVSTSAIPVVNGIASTSYTLPGFTPLGSYTISAVYSGGIDFAASTDNSKSLMVNAALTPVNPSTPPATAVTVIVTNNTLCQTACTVDSVQVLTQGAATLDFSKSSSGDTCSQNMYATGQSCTVSVNFNPQAPGVRMGAVELFDVSGNLLGTQFISGVGQAPLAALSPGIISTVAGVGSSNYAGYGSYGGDGGPAASAQLNMPYGIAFDGAGNLYIADYENNVIRMVAAVTNGSYTAGDMYTVAGNGTRGYGGDGLSATDPAVELDGPTAVAVDGAGNLYIADYQNSVVRMVSALTGKISTVAGNQPLGAGYNGDGIPATSAQLNFPYGLAVDGAGNLYISDYHNNLVREVSASSGIILTVAGNDSLGAGYSGDGSPATAAQLQLPQGLALDAAGNLYIADSGNNVIREVSATGNISTVAGNGAAGIGGLGGAATDASLYSPSGVGVDAAGDLYIVDFGVLEVSQATGNISQIAGDPNAGGGGNLYTGPATLAEMGATGIALDGAGNLYIADANSSVIREVNVSAGAIAFPNPTTVDTTDSTDGEFSLALNNIGNAPLTASSFSPAADFPQETGLGSDCTTGPSLAPGANCNLSFEFAPLSVNASMNEPFSVADNSGATPSATQIIALSGTSVAPEITITVSPSSSGLPGGAEGTAYSQTFGASGGTSPYTYTISSGALPSGLTLNSSTGVLTGTPSVFGNSSFTVTATDSSSPSDGGPFTGNQAYTLLIAGPPAQMVIISGATQTTATGAGFAQPLAVEVMDANNTPLPGVTVDFAAPGSGASAQLSDASAITGSNGIASVTARANETTGGPYTVTASVPGVTPASFSLTNIPITVYTVNTNRDDLSGNAANCNGSGSCSLRDALEAARETGSGAIGFDPTVFTAANLTSNPAANVITLTSGLDIPSYTTITGPAPVVVNGVLTPVVTVDGAGTYTVFSVDKSLNTVYASIANLTIADGYSSHAGGAIEDNGVLTVSNSVFSNNTGLHAGGALFNGYALSLIDCTFSGNSAPVGGVMMNQGLAVILGSTFTDNSASNNGGVIFNADSLTLIDSTLTGNFAGNSGGAIANSNQGSPAGAITITNSTITGNFAANDSGGIGNRSQMTLSNSIVSGNWDGTSTLVNDWDDIDDVSGGTTFNLVNGNNGGNVVGYYNNPATIAPVIALAPLGNYGGPTQTMIPLPGSVAICAGMNLTGPFWQDENGIPLTTDQRGTGYPNTNSTYTGYASTPCVDAGAVQTNYSLSFSTEPSASVTEGANFPISVTLNESGNAFPAAAGSVSLALTGAGTLTGGGAISLSTGVASFSTLSVDTVGTGDALTASMMLDAASSPVAGVSVASSSFDVSSSAPPAITVIASPATLPAGTFAVVYDGAIFSASGGSGPYTFTISAGNLPAGLALSSSGVLSGTPTAPGGFSFTVEATDQNSNSGSEPFMFTVGQATPTVTISNLPSNAVYNDSFTPALTYNGDGTASVDSNSLGICTVAAGVVHFVGVGTCSLTASATAGTNYAAVSGNTQTFAIGQATPTITISNLPSNAVYNDSFTPALTYNGDGTASVDSNSLGICTVAAGVVHFVGVGTCSLTASATAGTNYAAVSGSALTFVIGQATPTITISNLPSNAVYNGSFTPAFTYNGDGTASVDSNSLAVCTVAAGVVHFVGVGTCSLTASATAGTNYAAVSGSAQTFAIGQATPTNTISNLPSNAVYNGSFTPAFTYNGDGTASVDSNSLAVCTVAAGVVHFVGVGTCSLTASATAGTNYAAVSGSAQTFAIGAATATVTLSPATLAQSYTGSPLAVTATTSSPSGLAVTITYSGIPPTVYSSSSTAPSNAGSYAVVATINDADYSGSATGILAITPAGSSTTLTSNSNPAVLTSSVTFTATVASPAGSASGTVNFLDGTTPLGSSTLSGGSAALAISSLTAGVHSITAVYAGNSNLSGSVSGIVSETVVDFGLTGSGGNGGGSSPVQTTAPGGTATYTLAIAPTTGATFPAPTMLTVTGMPTGATMVISPSTWTQLTDTSWSFPANTPFSNITVTVQLPQSAAKSGDRDNPIHHPSPMLWGLLLLPFVGRLRRTGRRLGGLVALALLMAWGVTAVGLSGCGGHATTSSQQGTYTITMTITTGTLSHSTNLTLNVQ